MEQDLFNQLEEKKEVSIFNFEGKDIRTIIINNDIWFMASDVTKILGYQNGRCAIIKHCYIGVKYLFIQTNGGKQKIRFICKDDIISLINNSRTATTETKQKFMELINAPFIPIAKEYRESIALNVIEQIIGRPLYRQFRVLSYRIDGYDPVDKIAYEIDEEHHEGQKVADAKRQEEIEHVLGCTFKRVKV